MDTDTFEPPIRAVYANSHREPQLSALLVFSGDERGSSAKESRDSADHVFSSVSHTVSDESQAYELSDDINATFLCWSTSLLRQQ